MENCEGMPMRMGDRNREDKLSVFTSGAHLSLILWLFSMVGRGSAQ
jgi:hypothetical protein